MKWIDKLKSQLMALIFEHLEGGTRAEAVNEMQGAWQEIYRTLGLRENLGDEALRFAGTWARASRPNLIISQEDAASELVRVAGTELKSIMDVGKRLKAVVHAADQLNSNHRLSAVTSIVHARFVATAILLRKFPPHIEGELLGKWERVTFRIFGLGGEDARKKVGDYVRFGYDVGTLRISAEEISAGLSGLGANFSIDKVIDDPEYWTECYDSWQEPLRYLLFRYDEYLSQKAGEKLNASQWNKVWADDPSRSIEHIQPQSADKSYTNHLGNLTMLPPNVNSSLKDKPPVSKASVYKSCGLKGTVAVGETIVGGAPWNKAAVLSRAAEIVAFVRKEWAD